MWDVISQTSESAKVQTLNIYKQDIWKKKFKTSMNETNFVDKKGTQIK
jgi:hypothetical protein